MRQFAMFVGAFGAGLAVCATSAAADTVWVSTATKALPPVTSIARAPLAADTPLHLIVSLKLRDKDGLARYQSGQGLEREKLRLGSRLAPNWLWYRHRNRVVDRVFAAFEHAFRLDEAANKDELPPAVNA